MSKHFCQEIRELEELAAGLCEESEENAAWSRALNTLKDRLNSRFVEMETYYMARMAFHQEQSRMECSELERHAETCTDKYFSLLVKTKELRNRVDELDVKNKFYKSRTA